MTDEEIEDSLGLTFNFLKAGLGEITTIIEFMGNILHTIISTRKTGNYEHRTIVINKGEYPAWNFEASASDKMMLMEEGRKAARGFIEENLWIRRKAIQRRNSN